MYEIRPNHFSEMQKDALMQIQVLTIRTLNLFNFNFQSLKVVSRYRDPQFQVTENLC